MKNTSPSPWEQLANQTIHQPAEQRSWLRPGVQVHVVRRSGWQAGSWSWLPLFSRVARPLSEKEAKGGADGRE